MTTETGVYVELLGHKAKIAGIYSHIADGIWRKEDYLVVHVEFEEAVDSTLGFGFELPPKLYGKEEFMAAVTEEGEKRLSEILEESRKDREKRRLKEQRQGQLDSIVADIKSTIGLSIT